MIAEFGLAALWLAAALALLQLVAAALGQRAGGEALAQVVRPAAVVQGLLCALAFAMLLWLFLRTDLSVLLVASNSHSAKPLIFKLAGAWGSTRCCRTSASRCIRRRSTPVTWAFPSPSASPSEH